MSTKKRTVYAHCFRFFCLHLLQHINICGAFLKDDFDTAFTFASPSIRSMFGTAQNFGQMVQRGYPMVWRPQKFNFLEHRKDSAGRAQDIQIIDQSGTAHYLRYFLVDTTKGWKISGVQFLNPSDYSV